MTKPTRIDASTSERVHYKTMIETSHLGQWDLPKDRDVVVIIEAIEHYAPEVKRMKNGAPEKENKLRIFFKGKKKPLIANTTIQQTIAKIYGRIANDWIGKLIVLYVDPTVKMAGEVTGGVRVRPTVPNAKPTSDPLDQPVDQDKAAQLDRAAGRTVE